ncbi:hybrid sensor histidine kinase/response regulator [Haloarcula halophila]|uniref:hybrid sensor histidine kinase/response regulator n=1 Tax=Haloarcula TaxID=2237 RepID=UPI0023E3B2AB|nr:response regulator [Halomicroarcula sp. DFY41]
MNELPDTIQVLHVDDEPDFADMTATFLEREDERFVIETATSASAGAAQLEQNRFDCVISDYDMPSQNGIEFLKSVREQYPELPFILFTGKGSEEVASDAISAGVTDYLQKEGGTDQYTVLANRITNAVEHQRTREHVERSEQRLREIVDSLPHLLYVLDENGNYLLVNEALAAFHDSTVEDIEGSNIAEVLDGSAAAQFQQFIGETLETGTTKRAPEVEVSDPDGETHVFEPRLQPYEFGDVDDRAVLGIAADVTERKTYERRLATLNETTPELMAAETRTEVAEIGVEAAADVLGLEANGIHLYDEQSGLVPVAQTDAGHDLVGDPPTFTGEDSIAWRVYEQGEPLAIEDVHDHPDIHNPNSPVRSELILPLGEAGVLIASSPTAATFDDEDSVLVEILASNITAALEQVERTAEIRAREAELERQNERLEEFASVVSHDLRNPLQVAQGRLELLKEDCETEQVAPIERALDRMDVLIEDILTLAREGVRVNEMEDVALGEVCDACWQHVETGEATLEITTDKTIQADRSRLQQLIENLVRNAVEHGGDATTVTVGDLDSGFYIADDGRGIPADERESVFDAGYSTADDGTGFGLSIVKQVADAHGWTIRLTESETGGARFEITGTEQA